MKKLKILLRIIIILQMIFYISVSNAQIIKVDSISFKTYDFNVPLNSELVNKTSIPSNFRIANGVVTNASKFEYVDPIAWIKKVKADWIEKNNPEDNGYKAIKYGLVRTEDGYYIRKLNTIVTYGVVEIGGGTRIQRYLKILEKNFNELICLFNDSIINYESRVSLFPLNIPEWMVRNDNMFGFGDNQFMNNIKISFTFENLNYAIEYTSDLCKKGVSLGRSGTILPVDINVKLNFIANSQNKKQIIFQLPDGRDFSFVGMRYGDIDKDKELDMVITILYGAYKCNLVYLSSKKTNDNLVGYLGYYEVDVIDP